MSLSVSGDFLKIYLVLLVQFAMFTVNFFTNHLQTITVDNACYGEITNMTTG